MKKALIVIAVIFLIPFSAQAQKMRKFSPVYSNDLDINRTIAYVSENVVFDSLTYSRMGSLKGYVRCMFYVDPDGRFSEIKVVKGLAQWIDYEILTAMGSLPPMEPFLNAKGQKVRVKRDFFFTFGAEDNSYNWESPYGDPESIQASLDKQKRNEAEALIKKSKAWADFIKDNTKLSLDGQSIYKPGLLPNNPLMLNPPTTTPPVRMTIKSE